MTRTRISRFSGVVVTLLLASSLSAQEVPDSRSGTTPMHNLERINGVIKEGHGTSRRYPNIRPDDSWTASERSRWRRLQDKAARFQDSQGNKWSRDGWTAQSPAAIQRHVADLIRGLTSLARSFEAKADRNGASMEEKEKAASVARDFRQMIRELVGVQSDQAADHIRRVQDQFDEYYKSKDDEIREKKETLGGGDSVEKSERAEDAVDPRIRQMRENLERLQRNYANAWAAAFQGNYAAAFRAWSSIVNQADRLIVQLDKMLSSAVDPAEEDQPKLAGVSPDETAEKVMFTTGNLIPKASLAFQTISGHQAYLLLERFSRSGDLPRLNEFQRFLADVTTTARQELATVEKDHPVQANLQREIRELDDVHELAQAFIKGVRESRTQLAKISKEAPGGDEVMKGLLKQAAQNVAALPKMQITAIDPVAFEQRVLNVVASSAVNSLDLGAGGEMVKFNLQDLETSQPISSATAGTTLNITWQSEDEEENQVVTVNESGQAEAKRPTPNAQIARVLIDSTSLQDVGSGDLLNVSPVPGMPGLLDNIMMTPGIFDFFKTLTPEEKKEWISYLTAISYVMEAQSRETDPDFSQFSQETIKSLKRRVIGGVFIEAMLLATGQQSKEAWVPDHLEEVKSGKALDTILEHSIDDPDLRTQVREEIQARSDQLLKDNPELMDRLSEDSNLIPEEGEENAGPRIQVPVANLPKHISVETNADYTRKDLWDAITRISPDARVTVVDGKLVKPKFDPPYRVWTVRIRNADGSALDDQALGRIVERLDGDDDIHWAEQSQSRAGDGTGPDDPNFQARGSWGQKYHDQWALRRVGFNPLEDGQISAWPLALSQPQGRASLEPCIVAVIGSGVDWTHPELFGQMWVNLNEDPNNGIDDDGNGFADDAFGWNFRDDRNDVMDYGGHDTHVAGVIAASWNKAGIAGINPGTQIMALKVANYRAKSDSIAISRAIFYAVDNGARVINISYSGDSPSQFEQRAIDYARDNDVLVVASAGNTGVDAAKVALAGNPGLFTVAGSTVKDRRASFSNWGQPIDLAAPCMDILSLRARKTDFLLYLDENPDYEGGAAVVGKDENLYRASGTSFATPIVSGTASLIRSLYPDLSITQVRQMLLMSAEELETEGWDQFTGAGLLNASQAVLADPDYFLTAKITKVTPVRRGGKLFVQVRGQAEGSELVEHSLQIGFGENPGQDEWVTISRSDKPVAETEVVGVIPINRFQKRGVWTVRLLVQDGQKKVSQARGSLNLQ